MGSDARPEMILVVDDDPSMLRTVTRLLRLHGYLVETFSSAEAFIDARPEGAIACLLLDIHLGGMSGIELYRRLAASGMTHPAIFMTALDDEATEQEAARVGGIAYLRKPFPADELLDAIRSIAA